MLATWLKTSQLVASYSELAQIYDFVMRHVRYRDWARYLARHFARSTNDVRQVLDVSCGTGSLLLEFTTLGYQAHGMDYSPEMVRIARRKTADLSLQAPLWVGSMVDFMVKKEFDAIVSVYDSFNYCLEEAAARSFLRQAALALRRGGILVFDVSTQRNSKTYFRNYYDRDGTNEFEYIRQSHYIPDKCRQINEFYIAWKGQGKPFKERHVQRIYKLEEIRAMIPVDCFQILGIYSGFTMRPGSERSDRVHFVLRKTAD